MMRVLRLVIAASGEQRSAPKLAQPHSAAETSVGERIAAPSPRNDSWQPPSSPLLWLAAPSYRASSAARACSPNLRHARGAMALLHVLVSRVRPAHDGVPQEHNPSSG